MSRMSLFLLAVLFCAAGVGAMRWEAKCVAQGDTQGAARVQAAWMLQEAQRNEATAHDNIIKFRNAERTANEVAHRDAERQARDAAAAVAVRSLRNEVARLSARADPYPAGAAGLAACAREAATARELFDEGVTAYAELAAKADGLSDQVIGLQAWVASVCPATGNSIAGGGL